MFDLLEALARCAPRHALSGSMHDSWLYITDRKEKAPRWRGQTQDKRRARLGGKKSAPVEMNTTRGELFLALKQNKGLRLTPGRPYSREGANSEAEARR
jgi:hypothetical protein